MNFRDILKATVYKNDIELFFKEELRITPSKDQLKFLEWLMDLNNDKILVIAGRGAGKTKMCAGFALWAVIPLAMSLNHPYSVAILGGSKPQSDYCYDYIRKFLAGSEWLSSFIKGDILRSEVSFSTGGKIVPLPAGPKCFDERTRILSENGLKYFKDLRKDEKIATLNKKGVLEWQVPIRLIKEDYKGKMFSIETRTFSHLVTPNHNILAYAPHSKTLVFYKPEYLPTGARLKKRANWKGLEKNTFKLPAYIEEFGSRNQYSKFKCTRNLRKEKRIEMKNWLEFLGYFISEGYAKNDHTTVSIAQSGKKHPKEWKKIKSCLDKLPFKYGIDRKQTHFVICNVQLNDYLKQLGKSHEKYIPKELKELSKDNLKILLNSLLLGDGWKDKNGLHFVTSSKRLRDDIIEISQKIGIPSSFQEYKSKVGNPYWKMKLHSSKEIWFDKKQSRWINYEGKVYCVEVPNHTILVERNGTLVWSGNSIRGIHPDCLILDEGAEIERKIAEAALPTTSTSPYARTIWASTGHVPDCFFLDVLQKADVLGYKVFIWSALASDAWWVNKKKVEKDKLEMGTEKWEIEYLAKSASLMDTLISNDDFKRCIVESTVFDPALPTIAGCDWGEVHSAFLVLQRQDKISYVLEAKEWKRVKLLRIEEEIKRFYEKYEIDTIWADASHPGMNERLINANLHVKPVHITKEKKPLLQDNLKWRSERGTLKIDKDKKKLLEELSIYTSTTKRNDHLVDALMLALDGEKSLPAAYPQQEGLPVAFHKEKAEGGRREWDRLAGIRR